MISFFKELLYFIQRGRRGYSNRDVRFFNTYLNSVIPLMLRKLKKNCVACPSEFYDYDALNNECHKWEMALEKMARGFEAAEFINNAGYRRWVDSKDRKDAKSLEADAVALNNAKRDMEIGLALFAENYLNLWN